MAHLFGAWPQAQRVAIFMFMTEIKKASQHTKRC